ncbi:hypothetical protein NliqN6_6873 [Naganishia liquefaciens]|uniref:Aldehyde dehydrogenase domain-containing protein n=1 Tax=Naganishia liquefaciens TaxID=104408 RepID=A0A8H3U0P1_9TREE|nr:hypothetical protein NliqN6_6873 [Naganishia liquefaciens]
MSSELPQIQTTISPIDQQPVLTRPLLTDDQLDHVIGESVRAYKAWRKVSLDDRLAIAEKWMTEFEKMKDVLAEEITLQMGRPISQTPGEIMGTLGRAKHLISIARESLADIPQTDTDTDALKRTIRREPLGVVAIVAPWNFPYLTMINSVLPALIAGNTVIIKPSPQTPTPAERLCSTLALAGLPPNVAQVVHLSPAGTSRLAQDPRVGFLSFTGSVQGGKQLAKAAVDCEAFKGVGLELGGKDPAYVRPQVDVKWAAAELVDGAMFNSGQSCCGIERIYVHASIYEPFIAEFASVARAYKLGDPRSREANLGPVVSVASADRIRKQVRDAVAAGAKELVGQEGFDAEKEGNAFVGPKVLVDVTHEMDVMMEETFGPVVGIMKVDSDEEALTLMNDSPYGLTASIWTDIDAPGAAEAFEMFAQELETGTVFLNRCDFLDPALAWTGVKNSGRGVSLSKFGYDQLTRPKSIHMKIKTT